MGTLELLSLGVEIMSNEMGNLLFGKHLIPRRVELLSLNLRTSEEYEGELNPKITIQPSLESDNEKEIVITCMINICLGEKGPFEIELKLKGNFMKVEDIKGEDALKAFRDIGYPIIAEACLLIAEMTRAMKMIPLVLSPEGVLEKGVLEMSGEGGDCRIVSYNKEDFPAD